VPIRRITCWHAQKGRDHGFAEAEQMSLKRTGESLIERLKLVDACEDVASETVKALGTKAAEEYAKDLGDAFAKILPEIAGSIGGTAGKLIVRLIFKVSDSISSKLDALTREPFNTGLRVANESFALEIQNENERRFREGR